MSWGRECKESKDGGERAGGGTMLPPFLSPGISGGSPSGGLSSLVTGGDPYILSGGDSELTPW